MGSPPGGFVLRFNRGNTTSVQVLLPDGRLWEYLSEVSALKEGRFVDLREKFDDRYLTLRSGSVSIGAFEFFADLTSGVLCARTRNYDGERTREWTLPTR